MGRSLLDRNPTKAAKSGRRNTNRSFDGSAHACDGDHGLWARSGVGKDYAVQRVLVWPGTSN